MDGKDYETGEHFESVEAWLASRPESVQALAREFPLGTEFAEGGAAACTAWLIGYTESDELIFSRVNPYQDYDRAIAERFYCDVSAVREFIAAATDCSHVRAN